MVYKDEIWNLDVLVLADGTIVRSAEDYTGVGTQIFVTHEKYTAVGVDLIVLNLGNINITKESVKEIRNNYPEYFV